MNPFFSPGKNGVPGNPILFLFPQAGQIQPGKRKWGPDRGPLAAGLARIEPKRATEIMQKGKKTIGLIAFEHFVMAETTFEVHQKA